MDSHEDSCMAAAGSLFLSLDYPHEVDHQLNLLAKEEQHASAHHHHPDHDHHNDDSMHNDNSDNHINTMMQGGMLFDMLSTMHFSAAGNLNNRNDLGMDSSSYNQQAAADHQGWQCQVADQQTGGFDPICFLKLPVLATQNPGNVSSDQGHNYLPYYSNNNATAHSIINQQRDYALSLSNYWSSSMQTDQEEYSMSCSTTVDDMHQRRMIMQGFDNPDNDNNNLNNDEYDAMTCGEGGEDQRLQEAGRDEMDGAGHAQQQQQQQLLLRQHEKGYINPALGGGPTSLKAKRKRTRACKNSEEIESQRMTHIAVERNRRRQMNEHLRVLRALMPPSYVQRGDQASIIGGAIEFVKELEQLLQCLESQKRRRMYSSSAGSINNSIAPSNGNDLNLTMRPTPPAAPPAMMSNNGILQLSSDHITAASSLIDINGGTHPRPDPLHLDHHHPLIPLPQQNIINMPASRPAPPPGTCHSSMLDSLFEPLRLEDVAEARSAMADIEVKLLGCDAIIKILSQRRPRQLLNTIAALEELCFTIFHTNITTIDHTVLYSFTVKVGHIDETSTAKDIATSVQQIFINLIQNPIDQLLD